MKCWRRNRGFMPWGCECHRSTSTTDLASLLCVVGYVTLSWAIVFPSLLFLPCGSRVQKTYSGWLVAMMTIVIIISLNYCADCHRVLYCANLAVNNSADLCVRRVMLAGFVSHRRHSVQTGIFWWNHRRCGDKMAELNNRGVEVNLE